MQTKSHKQGFTIIEVVLVLAIAGLIFLMVFVALPALQRSQKDTQRRQDYADLSAAISNYMTNNNGKLPKAGASLSAAQYINANGNDPDGIPYKIVVKEATSGMTVSAPTKDDESSTVYVYTSANCDGSADSTGYSQPKYTNSTRSYAIYGYLETGTYCQSNQ